MYDEFVNSLLRESWENVWCYPYLIRWSWIINTLVHKRPDSVIAKITGQNGSQRLQRYENDQNTFSKTSWVCYSFRHYNVQRKKSRLTRFLWIVLQIIFAYGFFRINFLRELAEASFSILKALAPGNVKESDASKIKTHDDGGDDDHFINLLFCQPRCFIAHNKFKPWEDQENAWLHKSGSTILPMRVLPNFFVARRIP